MAQSNPATKDNATVIDVKKPTSWRRLITVLLLVVVVAASVVGYITYRSYEQSIAADNVATQRTLEYQLTTALSNTDNQAIADTTAKLIAGANSGKFKIVKPDLASLYLQRAGALYNLKRYPQALTNYTTAGNTDSSSKLAALQGEANTDNALGKKQELISVLRQIIKFEQNGNNPNPFMASDVAHYQAVIQAIQNNQEYEL
jgi:tetratricopeptide (TPR) repeat protein